MEDILSDKSPEGAWERAKAVLIATLKTPEEQSRADRYFSMITKVEKDGVSFFLKVSNSTAAEFLNANYAEKVKLCLGLMGEGEDVKVSFTVDDSPPPPPPVEEEPAPRYNTQESEVRVNHEAGARPGFISTMPLKEEYTFEEFVSGPSNSWAYSAAQGVVQNPGEKSYNPLFIHGGTGLGKTHLMQAIGNELKKKNKNLAVCYITAETLLNEYINCLKNGTINSFRDKYRNVDCLLIDDVQFLQRKNQFQEEFFNTFNYLQGKNHQIVMTSDMAPKDLKVLDERLISRFIGGLVQEIDSPSYETRLAILKKKTEGKLPVIPLSTLNFIAENIKSHVRAMEGALAKVKMVMLANPGEEIPQIMLERLLKDFIESDENIRRITVADIQSACAKHFNVSVEDILSNIRPQTIVNARLIAMYIAKKYTTLSSSDVGRAFNKSHATVLSGVKSIQGRIATENELRESLDVILQELGLRE